MVNEFWDCSCGKSGLKGKFCTKCGKKRELYGNKDERGIKLGLEGSTVSSDEVAKSNEKEERNQKDKYGEKKIIYGLLKNKKVLLTFLLIFVILLALLGLFFSKKEQNDTPMPMGTFLSKGNVNSAINREALFSKSEQGIKEFKQMLISKNEKEMAQADGVIWITTNVHKKGADIFVEGAYFNGTNAEISFVPEMEMDIFFYTDGKETGSVKEERFDKIRIVNLGVRKKKKIRYRIVGKGRDVGDFSTFLIKTKFK